MSVLVIEERCITRVLNYNIVLLYAWNDISMRFLISYIGCAIVFPFRWKGFESCLSALTLKFFYIIKQ